MKYLMLCVFLFSGLETMSAQASIDDAIMLTAITRIHQAEKDRLDDIERKHKKITFITRGLAYTSARLTIVERRLHQRLFWLHDLLDNAEVIYQIIDLGEDISKAQEDIYEIASENEQLLGIAADGEIRIMRRAIGGISQFLISSIESRFNLLNNKDRLDLLSDVVDILRIVLKDTLDLRDTIRVLLLTDAITLEEIVLNIDITPYFEE